MKKQILITLLMGIYTTLSAQDVNSANTQITQKHVMSYSQLKQY